MAYWTENSSLSDVDDVDQSLNTDVLVIRAQDGEQQALETLYTRYNNQINVYWSRRIGNDSVSRELTQEAFLKAWSALPKLRNPASFVGWLYRIALNCMRDRQRSLKHEQTVSLELCTGGEEELSVEGPEASVEQSELLQMAFAQLPRMHRACLILYVIEGLPQRQIAERLKIKESCVSEYVSRGKKELRQTYKQLLQEKGPSAEKA